MKFHYPPEGRPLGGGPLVALTDSGTVGYMIRRLGYALGMGFAGVALLLPGLAPAGAEPSEPSGPGGVQVTTVRYGPFVLPPAGKGGDVDHANVVMPDLAK